ncbi:hypothetical protein POSPLADRAFT_1056586 [Postia placenta MAD-698-R-SB12]|uniref:Fungal STAND N-terminal Goodbye domain-containing protein n=1 Tax=Postia placenta MAD-698-R-SB12 TaxID=670580 RepID=A0A1X6N059_9APHY|nr:hypothetical protein POSPLADRAFT_1056586 [Postia placenta MAD-698-R-SB12]OSX61997.1 hypothetical protein POSPLADRAFT_1056586 [Postia placenta MAD-698-R-SB12]
MEDAATQVLTAHGLPPVWSKALKRFKDCTNIDLEAIDNEAESPILGLRTVIDAKSLSTTVRAKSPSNKKLKNGLDRNLESCKRVFGDVDRLLNHVMDAEQGNVRRSIIFRSFAALFLSANDSGDVNAIVRLWDQVPLMECGLANNVTESGRAPFENVLMSYVTLVGTAYNVITKKHHGDTLSSDRDVKQVLSELHWEMHTLQWIGDPLDDQIKRGWEHTLVEYASLVGVWSPNFPRKVASTVELQSQLHALGLKESATVQLRANARELADLIVSRRIHENTSDDIDPVVLGALLTLAEASRGKTTAVALIADLMAEITKILKHLPPITQKSESSAAIVLVQIKATTLRIVGEGAKTLHSVSVPWISSSLFARNDKLQATIRELAWLVEKASTAYAAQGKYHTVSTSRFNEIWEKARRRYTASTGVDISAWAAVQHIDALTSIETTLENGRYTFQQEHRKAEEIAKVVWPVLKFMKTFVDSAADLAEPHLPGVKLAAAALEKLLDTADKLGSSYERILSLFDALSDFLDRMRVHLTSRPDIEIMEIHEEVLAEMLVIFGMITGHINKGFLERLTAGDDDIKATTTRLRALLDKEDRMTGALVLSKLNDVKQTVEEGFASMSGSKAGTQSADGMLQFSFPPRPVLFFGRKEEREYLVDAILQRKQTIALGTGGIGKTTVITEALYDDRVLSQFTCRYFVSCEDITTLDGLRTGIADALGMLAELRTDQLRVNILLELAHKPSILFLDNFETLFDIANIRSQVETELEAYAGINGLALVITMRGAEAPASGRLPWSRHILHPMSQAEGVVLFKRITEISADDQDPYVDKLVSAVDSLPLAVVLLAHQAHKDIACPRDIWCRWEDQRVASVTRSDGVRGRLLDLSSSIELSINSPRMQEDAPAAYVMTLLAHMPNGLPSSTVTWEKL